MYYIYEYHIYDCNPMLVEKIHSLGVKYHVRKSLNINKSPESLTATFILDESKPYAAALKAIVPPTTSSELIDKASRNEIPFPVPTVISLAYPMYTKEEFNKASWLIMGSNVVKGSVIEELCTARSCYLPSKRFNVSHYTHIDQSGPIVIQKPIKWRENEYFGHLLCGIIGCSNTAQSILAKEGIRGIEYLPIYCGKSQSLQNNIFQIHTPFEIPNTAFILSDNTHWEPCPLCGRKKLTTDPDVLDFDYELSNTLLDFDTDVFLTRAFGFESLYISKKMYGVLLRNKMTRGLRFTPIFTAT